MGETLKTGSRQAVIGLRLSEPLFQVVNGTTLEYIQQVNNFITLFHSAIQTFFKISKLEHLIVFRKVTSFIYH